MRSALEEPTRFMPFLDPYLPYYDPIRDTPAFQALMAEMAIEA